MRSAVLAVSITLASCFQAPSGAAEPQKAASTGPAYRVLLISGAGDVVLKARGGVLTVTLLGVEPPSGRNQGAARSVLVANLKRSLEGHAVVAWADPTVRINKQTRPVVHLRRVSDGLWVNEEMVRRGWAATASAYAFEAAEGFRELEAQAREQKLGLWSAELLARAVKDYDVEQAERKRRWEAEADRAWRRREMERIRRIEIRKERERQKEEREREREHEDGR